MKNSLKKPVRNVASKKGAYPVPQKVQELTKDFYENNATANLHGAKAKKVRASLLEEMKLNKLAELTFPVEIFKKVREAKVVVATPKNNAVDVAKLAKLVDYDTLLKIVSATQKAVQAHVSGSVLEQCLVEMDGTENVSVELLDEEG